MSLFKNHKKTEKKKSSTVTEVDVDKLYRRPASLTDWLPWTDYEEESQTFTLEDGYSAAAMFEITGVSTEARSEQFLREVQANIQTCINHTIPAHDNPFVLQCFVADEDSLSPGGREAHARAHAERVRACDAAHVHRDSGAVPARGWERGSARGFAAVCWCRCVGAAGQVNINRRAREERS